MIIKEISSDSYEVRGIMEVDLQKKHKTSKNRHAKIYDFQITNNQFKPLRNINEEYIWRKDAKG